MHWNMPCHWMHFLDLQCMCFGPLTYGMYQATYDLRVRHQEWQELNPAGNITGCLTA